MRLTTASDGSTRLRPSQPGRSQLPLKAPNIFFPDQWLCGYLQRLSPEVEVDGVEWSGVESKLQSDCYYYKVLTGGVFEKIFERCDPIELGMVECGGVDWTGLDWSNEALPVCQHLCNIFWKSTYQLL